MKNFKISIVLFVGTLFFCWVQTLFPSILPAIGVLICSIATYVSFNEDLEEYLKKRKEREESNDNTLPF